MNIQRLKTFQTSTLEKQIIRLEIKRDKTTKALQAKIDYYTNNGKSQFYIDRIGNKIEALNLTTDAKIKVIKKVLNDRL